jgi:hypothetical protein
MFSLWKAEWSIMKNVKQANTPRHQVTKNAEGGADKLK